MKKKEFKTVKQRAKEIVERSDIKMVDRYNWKMKKWLTPVESLEALIVLANFITIPTNILNEEESKMFDERLFEQIKVS